MRQVDLGLSQWSILRVNDKVFNQFCEEKCHIQYVTTEGLNININFIQKSSTDSELSFLRSPFEQYLKNKKIFRIVTDMLRKNERLVHDTGARLIKQSQQLCFENKCLVFTSNE
jgi:hypothetical protein